MSYISTHMSDDAITYAVCWKVNLLNKLRVDLDDYLLAFSTEVRYLQDTMVHLFIKNIRIRQVNRCHGNCLWTVTHWKCHWPGNKLVISVGDPAISKWVLSCAASYFRMFQSCSKSSSLEIFSKKCRWHSCENF